CRIRQPGTLAWIPARLQPMPSDRNGGHAFVYKRQNLGHLLQNQRRNGWWRQPPWPGFTREDSSRLGNTYPESRSSPISAAAVRNRTQLRRDPVGLGCTRIVLSRLDIDG